MKALAFLVSLTMTFVFLFGLDWWMPTAQAQQLDPPSAALAIQAYTMTAEFHERIQQHLNAIARTAARIARLTGRPYSLTRTWTDSAGRRMTIRVSGWTSGNISFGFVSFNTGIILRLERGKDADMLYAYFEGPIDEIESGGCDERLRQ
jgi:hypothetical protein